MNRDVKHSAGLSPDSALLTPTGKFLFNLLLFGCLFWAAGTYGADLGIADSVKTLVSELWQAGKYFYYIVALGVMGMGIWKWAHDHDASKGITLIVIGAVCCLIPWMITQFSNASASADPFGS